MKPTLLISLSGLLFNVVALACTTPPCGAPILQAACETPPCGVRADRFNGVAIPKRCVDTSLVDGVNYKCLADYCDVLKTKKPGYCSKINKEVYSFDPTKGVAESPAMGQDGEAKIQEGGLPKESPGEFVLPAVPKYSPNKKHRIEPTY